MNESLPRAAIERQLVLLPLYVVGAFLGFQLYSLLATPGARDSAGLVKGHDFVQFYALGTLAAEGRWDALYDGAELNRLMWRLVPESTGDAFPPLYTPPVALAFSPLSTLSYVSAVYVWLAFTVVCYIVASALAVSLAGRLPISRISLWVLLMTAPALNVTLVAGQTSAVTLVVVCIAWWLMSRGQSLAAGLAFGMLAYKPQLLVGPVALLLLVRDRRVVTGIGLGACAQLALAWGITDAHVMASYVSALAGPIARASIPEPIPEHVHGLAGFWRLLLGQGRPATALFLLSGAGVLVLAARAWNRTSAHAEHQALLLLTSVLLSAHLYAYDLLLLMPALLGIWAWSERQLGANRQYGRVLVWLGWCLPLAAQLALATKIQWSAPVLVAAVALMSRAESAESSSRP